MWGSFLDIEILNHPPSNRAKKKLVKKKSNQVIVIVNSSIIIPIAFFFGSQIHSPKCMSVDDKAPSVV